MKNSFPRVLPLSFHLYLKENLVMTLESLVQFKFMNYLRAELTFIAEEDQYVLLSVTFNFLHSIRQYFDSVSSE